MEAEIKVIETEAEYERALADFGRLFAAPDDSPERETRDLLALRLKNYEDKKYPIAPPEPIAAIKFRMDQEN